jgi:hypothetical protein
MKWPYCNLNNYRGVLFQLKAMQITVLNNRSLECLRHGSLLHVIEGEIKKKIMKYIPKSGELVQSKSAYV